MNQKLFHTILILYYVLKTHWAQLENRGISPFSVERPSIVGLTHHSTLDQRGLIRQKRGLFFSVCVSTLAFTLVSLNMKTGAKGCQKSATRPPRFKLSRRAEALDAITVLVAGSRQPTMGSSYAFPDRRAWTGAGYSARSMRDEKERERQLLLLLLFIRIEKRTRNRRGGWRRAEKTRRTCKRFVSTCISSRHLDNTNRHFCPCSLYPKHNGIQSFFQSVSLSSFFFHPVPFLYKSRLHRWCA